MGSGGHFTGHERHRSFAEILVAVKSFRAGEDLTWDHRGLLTQALPMRMGALEDLTGTKRRHTYLMLADRIRTNAPLNCVEELALEELEECLKLAQDEESRRESREMGRSSSKMDHNGLIPAEEMALRPYGGGS